MSNVGVQNDSDKMHMHVYSTSVTGALSDAGASIKRGTSRSLPVAVRVRLPLAGYTQASDEHAAVGNGCLGSHGFESKRVTDGQA